MPDFRGPTGVWTLQRLGLPTPNLEIEFGAAKPTVTHQASRWLSAPCPAEHRPAWRPCRAHKQTSDLHRLHLCWRRCKETGLSVGCVVMAIATSKGSACLHLARIKTGWYQRSCRLAGKSKILLRLCDEDRL